MENKNVMELNDPPLDGPGAVPKVLIDRKEKTLYNVQSQWSNNNDKAGTLLYQGKICGLVKNDGYIPNGKGGFAAYLLIVKFIPSFDATDIFWMAQHAPEKIGLKKPSNESTVWMLYIK